MRITGKSSLSMRLLGVAALAILAAAAVAGLAIGFLFESFFEDQLRSDLKSELNMLTDRISVSESGEVLVGTMADPRYQEPLSGLYWQITPDVGEPRYSRSLWDQTLPGIAVETTGHTASAREEFATGEILVLSWKIQLIHESEPFDVELTVAKSLTDFKSSVSKFNSNVTLWLVLLSVALILASWIQVRVGLRPLESIRSELSKLNNSKTARLPTDYPMEVQPLVEEVNSMLDFQDHSLQKARNSAGNLAHGLKTPLTILVGLADKIKAIGQPALAEELNLQIDQMNTIVESELARARTDQSMRSRTRVLPVADNMVKTMRHMPNGMEIDWDVRLDEEMMMPFDAHDLSELLGNLLDNARKHANSRVAISGKQSGRHGVLLIDDDGPGIPDELLEKSLNRGETLSTEGAGHGIGLSIVKDLVVTSNCELRLSRSPLGGLKIEISY